MKDIRTWLYTLLKGRCVGCDAYGNQYYIEKNFKPSTPEQRERRWVIYNGVVEASKVPASWHGWLHYTTDEIPDQEESKAYAWEKPHLPNMTGTPQAYRPSAQKTQPSQGYYVPWQP